MHSATVAVLTTADIVHSFTDIAHTIDLQTLIYRHSCRTRAVAISS